MGCGDYFRSKLYQSFSFQYRKFTCMQLYLKL
jgi:hypothetical protein